MVVVIDNASVHTSEAFEDCLPRWKKEGLIIKYLSTYSPELNLIEILWRNIKYTWLPFSAYQCLNALRDALENILKDFGSKYRVDFSVVLFRPNFMLASEGYLVKVHKNQRLLTLPSPPNLPCGATNHGTYHGVWWADAFAGTWQGRIPSDVGLQTLENKVLSWSIIGKSAPILAEITIRKSQE